ncbi:MAG: hypothetical protein ACLFPJ_01230 [Candidatus Woesearchaeota archaeon]
MAIIDNTKKKENKISKFFLHLVAYGGFNVQKGIINVWGDPCSFFPINAFVKFQKQIYDKIGYKKTAELFYWLGRLTGRNATIMLIKRFGVKKEDIPNFVNGATQDGFGYMKIQEYDLDIGYGIVTGENSTFAIEYKKEFSKQKEVQDHYIRGILSGGAEPLFNLHIKVIEEECMAQSFKKCKYVFSKLEKKPIFSFFKKITLNEDKIIEKTKNLSLKRQSSFKIIKEKSIKFGDGSFVLDNCIGINMMNYAKVILDEILKQLFPNEYEKILKEFAYNCIYSIKDRLINKNIRQILKELELFGFGVFEVRAMVGKKLILFNNNNPNPKNYLSLFKKEPFCIDLFSCFLLESAFKIVNKECEVIEKNCIAKGDKECIFEITFK